jgi:hypothetical protein
MLKRIYIPEEDTIALGDISERPGIGYQNVIVKRGDNYGVIKCVPAKSSGGNDFMLAIPNDSGYDNSRHISLEALIKENIDDCDFYILKIC